MTRELTIQDASAEALARALSEIQNRHIAARRRAVALAAGQAAAPVAPDVAPAADGPGDPA